MEKIWVLVWVMMSPQDDGVMTHDRGLFGPIEEHTCLVMADEISDLAGRVSEPHALIITCRKMRPEDATMLQGQPEKPFDPKNTRT